MSAALQRKIELVLGFVPKISIEEQKTLLKKLQTQKNKAIAEKAKEVLQEIEKLQSATPNLEKALDDPNPLPLPTETQRCQAINPDKLTATEYAYYFRGNANMQILSDKLANTTTKSTDAPNQPTNNKDQQQYNKAMHELIAQYHQQEGISEYLIPRNKSLPNILNKNLVLGSVKKATPGNPAIGNGPTDKSQKPEKKYTIVSLPKKRARPDDEDSSDIDELPAPVRSGSRILHPLGGEEPDSKYCVCQRTYSEGSLMFQCEGRCKNWYHPECLGYTKIEAEKISQSNDKWICNYCLQDETNGKMGRDMSNANGSGNGRQMAAKQQRPKKK